MKEIKEKKPRKFLKMLENVGTTVVQEVLLRVIRGVVSRIGGKKQLPSILFILASCSLFAQYPATGNKQRLGYQTTGDGLVWRGRANDTVALKSSTINNAYIILDTVNNVIYNYINTKGGWVYNNSDTVIVNNSIDTTSLSNRINLKADKSITLSTTTPLQGGGDLSANRTLSILSASDSQSGIVNTNSQLFSGNKVFKHRLTADSLLFLNNTTPIPVDILGLNSTGNVNSVGKFTLGSGLSVSTGTLLADTSFLVTRFDTTSMLIPYLRKADTTNMLNPYFRDADTTQLNLTSRFNTKLNISDTTSMLTNYLRTGVASSTYFPLTGGTTSGLITSSFNNSNNYSSGVIDNNAFQIFNTTSSTNNIYGGIQFFLGAAGGVIPGGEGLAQIYALRKGGLSDASTDLLFALKGVGGTLEKMRIKFDGKVGIGTSTPSYLLDVNGQIGSTGFIKSGGTSSQFLKADGSVDANTYLTTGTASSTYLPLSGGTVSGTIRRQDNNYNESPNTFYFNILNYFARRDNEITGNQTAQITFTDRPGTFNFPNAVRTSDIHLMTAHNWNGSAYGQYLDTTLSVVANQDGGRIGISKLNPSYKLDVNGTFNASGNSLIGGTLGVTGAATLSSTLAVTSTTTLSGALTVNNATVLNEGSGDHDTRIESDGNANMVFVDASTDKVGIGTNSPSKTLDVNGEVKIATVTATPTSLLGKDGSNVVGEVTTVAQTGLFTRGSTNVTTASPSAIFTVTHGLGSNPSAVIVTSAGIGGAEKIIYEVYAKNSTTFSVQAWNYDGTEAANKNVTIYWFAIK